MRTALTEAKGGVGMEAVELVRDVRLRRIRYKSILQPRDNENTSGNFLLILPLVYGRARLERHGEVLHDGAVQPGFIRVVRPGERSRLTPATAFESAMLAVPAGSFDKVLRAQGRTIDDAGPLPLPPVINTRYDVQRLIPLFKTAAEFPPEHRSLLISGLVLALLALLLNTDARSGADRGPGFDEEEFDAILKFASGRLSEHLDLAEWADLVNLTTNEFARRFQQHTGVAPYTWFMDRRIDEAKRLMLETDQPLVEVALDSGFCSQSHFTEAFRRRVGTSPGRWRSVQSAPQT